MNTSLNVTSKGTKGPKRSKKAKKPIRKPAKQRYLLSGGLAMRKIRALVRSGYSLQAALDYWEKARTRPKGVVSPSLYKMEARWIRQR